MDTSFVVDFYGPVAFRFSGLCAWAYLPLCCFHACNVLTDHDDKSPDRHHTYLVRGPKGGSTQVGKKGPYVVQLDWSKDTCGNEPTDGDCYCVFQLPLPDSIYGLRGEYASIKDLNGQEWGGDNCARGLRFCYGACDTLPTIIPAVPIQPKPDGSNDLSNLDATSIGPGSDVQYHIEIRFHDLNPVFDPDNIHADANMCSATMRQLFPPLDQWAVSFDKPPYSGNLLKPLARPSIHLIPPYAYVGTPGHPVDCGANVLVFNDGGLASP